MWLSFWHLFGRHLGSGARQLGSYGHAWASVRSGASADWHGAGSHLRGFELGKVRSGRLLHWLLRRLSNFGLFLNRLRNRLLNSLLHSLLWGFSRCRVFYNYRLDLLDFLLAFGGHSVRLLYNLLDGGLFLSSRLCLWLLLREGILLSRGDHLILHLCSRKTWLLLGNLFELSLNHLL